MKILPIALPTPFLVGDVNVYLIEDEPLTLIDTGPKTKEAVAALREGLRSHNYKLSDIRRIVLTHAHEDHCGLAKTIRDEAKDAEILVHGWETGHLFGRIEKEESKNLLVRAGIPFQLLTKIGEFYDSFKPLTDALEDNEFNELHDEAELEFASGSWKILHTPGHTPGSCSFLREANRTLIAGDCVLKRITPNPVLSVNPIDGKSRFHSLAEYLVSLAKIRSYAPTYIYGGHGEPISDYEEIFNRYLRLINKRQTQILSLVDKKGVTAWDVANKLFPHVITDDTQRFLAVSEAVAHLDFAVLENRMAVEFRAGIEFFRKL